MKISIKLIVFTFLFASCSSQKTISKETIKEYQQKGYTFGVMKLKKTGDCPWIITVEGSDIQYDPVNLEDQKFISLKANKTGFFFKFSRLRMQNRCNEAAPIRITEVAED